MSAQRDGGADGGAYNLAELIIDDLYLLLPREQVVHLAQAQQVQRQAANGGWCGSIVVDGRRWPVLALDAALQPHPQGFAWREVCALLRAGDRGFGLLADAVNARRGEEVRPVALPPAMASARRWVSALAIVEDYLACLGSAQTLFEHYTLSEPRAGKPAGAEGPR